MSKFRLSKLRFFRNFHFFFNFPGYANLQLYTRRPKIRNQFAKIESAALTPKRINSFEKPFGKLWDLRHTNDELLNCFEFLKVKIPSKDKTLRLKWGYKDKHPKILVPKIWAFGKKVWRHFLYKSPACPIKTASLIKFSMLIYQNWPLRIFYCKDADGIGPTGLCTKNGVKLLSQKSRFLF
mgnify:CR=1 FL=1